MTSINSTKGAGGHKIITPTQYLVGMWPITNGTGITNKTLVDWPTGSGYSLKTVGTSNVSAGFWGTSGRGTFGGTDDYFGNPDLTAYNLGGTNTSFIFSCRIKSALAPTAFATIMSNRNQASAVGIDFGINATTGTLLTRFNHGAGSQNITGTGNICNNTDRHIVLVYDKTGNRNIYLDGAVNYASGTQAMAGINGDASPSSSFVIGANKTDIDTGAANNKLWDGTTAVQLFDCHLYVKEGALPSNLTSLIGYLKDNIYSPIPSSLW